MLSHLTLFRNQLRHFNSEKSQHDHYATLNVSWTASKEEIRKAFLEEAKKVHPDKLIHFDAIQKEFSEDRFKRINEAYEVLGDPMKRKKYDVDRGHRKIQNFDGKRGKQFGLITKRKRNLTFYNLTVVMVVFGVCTAYDIMKRSPSIDVDSKKP